MSRRRIPARVTSSAKVLRCQPTATPWRSGLILKTATPRVSMAARPTTAPAPAARSMSLPAAVRAGPSRPMSRRRIPARMTSSALASHYRPTATPWRSEPTVKTAMPRVSMATTPTTAPAVAARSMSLPAAVRAGPSRPMSRRRIPARVTSSATVLRYRPTATPWRSGLFMKPAMPRVSMATRPTTAPAAAARCICTRCGVL